MGLAAEEGLVAHWDFNEGQGIVVRDASGNWNDAVMHDARWVKNNTGYCLEFDGLQSYINCGDQPGLDLRKDMTIELWIYPTGRPTGEPGVIGKQFSNFLMTYYSDGQVYFYIGAGGNNANAPVSADGWHHVAGTFDGTDIKLYVDGQLVSRRQSRFPEAPQGGKFLIGTVAGAEQASDPNYRRTSFFAGLLDEVRVYNRPLTAEEIAAHAQAETPAFELAEDFNLVQPAQTLRDGDLRVVVGRTGNLEVRTGGEAFVLDSFYSYPGEEIGWNALAHEATGQQRWEPTVRAPANGRVRVEARGEEYRLAREVSIQDGVVIVEDTLRNPGSEPVGVMMRHYVTVEDRLSDSAAPGTAANPTLLVATERAGLGVLMEDNLSRLHMEPRVGTRTNQCSYRLMDMAVDAGQSLTFRTVLMPLARGAGYFDFMNRVRQRWASNFPVLGPFNWINMTDPMLADPARLKAWLQRKQAKLMALSPWLDYDPGTEDRVWTREEYKQWAMQAAQALRQAQPDIKVLGCIETDWSTIYPERIPDGDKLPVAGQSGGGLSLEQTQILERANLPFVDSAKREKDGSMRLELYMRGGKPQTALSVYPAVGNYQYEFLMGQVKFLLDELGLDGYYIDEFSQAWGGSIRTYGKWDGVSVSLDPRTGRISEQWTDCSLAGIEARVNLQNYAFERGKVVVANTYATAMEEQALPANRFSETQGMFDPMATPDGEMPVVLLPLLRSNLASPIGLGIIGRPDLKDTARRIMKAVVTYLRHGMVYYHYAIEDIPESGPGSGEYGPINHMFPITPVESGAGFIRGQERILACVSGTYRWEQARRPAVLAFDLEGEPASFNARLTRRGEAWDVELTIADWAAIAVVE
jgi:hypothetical protein